MKWIKEFNIKEHIEPPALKIRIFKGYSGELINEKEAKPMRKRKKKTEKPKVKVAKATFAKGNIHSSLWGNIKSTL